MLEKLFGWGKKKGTAAAPPPVTFGRYSDNNKPVGKVNRWTDADNLFKEKKYPESLDAFFEYLRDDERGNVVYERNGDEGRFHFFQGSKIVRGHFTPAVLQAEVTLAGMPQPSVPVMRRLLEMNFNLYYSRFALDGDRLCMRFDSDLSSASPSKLYYGFKEMATRADKQDDLLVQDFGALQPADTDHIDPLPDAEKEVKYAFTQQWIRESLESIEGLDADKFSGGIAYLLLSLLYRIDYLVAPEGKLLNELERITGIYYRKDERSVQEKNRDMLAEIKKIQAFSREEFYRYLYRSRYTFSIVAPQQHKVVSDSIYGANQTMIWYRDNNYPAIAIEIIAYGISYCQYSYSLPKVITDLFQLFMEINHADFFLALGFAPALYDPAANRFEEESIRNRILDIQSRWKEKFPLMDFRTENIRFASLLEFNFSFTNELQNLNMEPR